MPRLLTSYSGILGIIVAWQVLASYILPSKYRFFLPSISSIVLAWIHLLGNGTLIGASLLSIYRASIGLLLAILIGVPIGLGMARKRQIHWAFNKFVSIGFPLPKLAFLPAFILWFGIGSLQKIALVTFECAFIIIVSTYSGAIGVKKEFIWSARAMGTPERKIFQKIVFPHTLPSIFNGLRVAVPISLIVTFVAEMVGGGGGLGFVLIYAARFFDVPSEFAALFTIVGIGYLLDKLILIMRERILRWHDIREAI